MLARPLAPTLFPYTTLFRSYRSGRGVARIDVLLLLRRSLPRVERIEVLPVHQDLAAHLEIPGVLDRKRNRLDRKSTRLNSSHQIISYAVFCLKKKSQTGRTRAQMLVAYGVRRDGRRHLLAFLRSQGESQAEWEGFVKDLYRQGGDCKRVPPIV